MRIRTFNTFAQHQGRYYNLKNCPVVIDGYNYLYEVYQDSGLPFAFGCECDKLADYLREHLSMFQKANVTCHFIFRGGIENIEESMNNHTERQVTLEYDPKEKQKIVFQLILTQDVCKQVLKELGINYRIYRTNAKKNCIALARKIKCPIISINAEYCFSDIPYIYKNTLRINESADAIECRVFKLSKLLEEFSLTKEKIVIFIVLRDTKIFPEGVFDDFFDSINILTQKDYVKNTNLFKWLSRRRRVSNVLEIIFKYISKENQILFLEKRKEVAAIVEPPISVGVPKDLKKDVANDRNDVLWFENGIASERIADQYTNLYADGIIKYSAAIQDPEASHAFLTALDIVKYAYTLLTPKENLAFTCYSNEGDSHKVTLDRCQWDAQIASVDIRSLTDDDEIDRVGKRYLFQIFLNKNPDVGLEHLPDDARLLLIALCYCATKSSHFTKNEAFSILLSYVMLSVVLDNCNEDFVISSSEILAGPADHLGVTLNDSLIAAAVLSKYFELTEQELIELFDRKLLHPLVEFQYCLQQFNYLNSLCGKPYKPTVYSKTYNGTFIYRILYVIKKKYNDNFMEFVRDNLKSASSVVAFLDDLMSVYYEYQRAMRYDGTC